MVSVTLNPSKRATCPKPCTLEALLGSGLSDMRVFFPGSTFLRIRRATDVHSEGLRGVQGAVCKGWYADRAWPAGRVSLSMHVNKSLSGWDRARGRGRGEGLARAQDWSLGASSSQDF